MPRSVTEHRTAVIIPTPQRLRPRCFHQGRSKCRTCSLLSSNARSLSGEVQSALHIRLSTEPIPLGQRLYDNVFLLLAVGLVVMFVLFTGWGMWEILTMPAGTLP